MNHKLTAAEQGLTLMQRALAAFQEANTPKAAAAVRAAMVSAKAAVTAAASRADRTPAVSKTAIAAAYVDGLVRMLEEIKSKQPNKARYDVCFEVATVIRGEGREADLAYYLENLWKETR